MSLCQVNFAISSLSSNPRNKCGNFCFGCWVVAQASLPHWNILCRPEVGEDYASSSTSSSSSSPFVCLNPENFDGREQDLLELKLLLKRNPRKNLNLAKKFFSQNPGHPSNLLDYDYQVKRLK